MGERLFGKGLFGKEIVVIEKFCGGRYGRCVR